jgi:hypothetical protein
MYTEWNVLCLYGAGALKLLDPELKKYKFNVIELYDVRYFRQEVLKRANTYYFHGKSIILWEAWHFNKQQ